MPKKAGEPRIEKGRNFSRATVTMDLELMKWAKQQAKDDGRNFSNWVYELIKRKRREGESKTPPIPPEPGEGGSSSRKR